MSPYRKDSFPSSEEENLWLRLDHALEIAIEDPHRACSIAWDVFKDCTGFKDVSASTASLLETLYEIMD